MEFYFFWISLFITSCEKDETFNENSLTVKKNNVIAKRVTLNEIKENQTLKQSLDKIEKQFDYIKKSNKSSKINSADNSFSILTDEILQVTTDSTEAYTFRIETPTHSDSVFENFVIEKQHNSDYDFYIYRYKKFEQQNQIDVSYSITKQPINDNLISLDDFQDYFNNKLYWDANTGCLYDVDHLLAADGETYYGVVNWVICYETGTGSYGGTYTGGVGYGTGSTGGTGDYGNNSGGYSGGDYGGSGGSNSSNLNSGNGGLAIGVLPALTMAEQLYNFLTLTPQQEVWANKPQNEATVQQIIGYMLGNCGLDNTTTACEEAEDFTNWVIEFEMLSNSPCGLTHNCIQSIQTMADGLRAFYGQEGILMADYFESVINDSNSFDTMGDLQDFYDVAKAITKTYNNYMFTAITGAFIEGITPILEIALFEVGASVGVKLLEKIPLSWVLQGTRLDNMILKTVQLGNPGYANARLIPNSIVSKAEALFTTLTKDAISIVPATNNPAIKVANMGNGMKIILRPYSTTVPEAIKEIEYQNFNTLLGVNSFSLKFMP